MRVRNSSRGEEGLDVERPHEVPRRAARRLLAEPRSAQHAAQHVDEQRQAEPLVRRVRAAERGQRATVEERRRVRRGPAGAIDDESFGQLLALRGRDPDRLHRDDGRRDVKDDRGMAPRGQAVRERVGTEDRGATTGRRHQRDEVGAREPDRAGLGRQARVWRRDQHLPVADGGHGHALVLPCALETPVHRARRRGRATATVAVEQQRPAGLAQHAHARARVQLAARVQRRISGASAAMPWSRWPRNSESRSSPATSSACSAASSSRSKA